MIDPADLTFLYLTFVAKHVLGDYVLQTGWMAAEKGAARNWLKPLCAHVGVHAILTFMIALVFAPSLWWLGLLDFVIHFAIDRTKGLATRGFKPAEQRFWVWFGLDQAAHQVTHFVYVLMILTA